MLTIIVDRFFFTEEVWNLSPLQLQCFFSCKKHSLSMIYVFIRVVKEQILLKKVSKKGTMHNKFTLAWWIIMQHYWLIRCMRRWICIGSSTCTYRRRWWWPGSVLPKLSFDDVWRLRQQELALRRAPAGRAPHVRLQSCMASPMCRPPAARGTRHGC